MIYIYIYICMCMYACICVCVCVCVCVCLAAVFCLLCRLDHRPPRPMVRWAWSPSPAPRVCRTISRVFSVCLAHYALSSLCVPVFSYFVFSVCLAHYALSSLCVPVLSYFARLAGMSRAYYALSSLCVPLFSFAIVVGICLLSFLVCLCVSHSGTCCSHE